MTQAADGAPALPDGIEMGPVGLTVADLDGAVAFYRDVLGLAVRGRDGEAARLGTAGRDLVELAGRPGAIRDPSAAGLFHVALLLPGRADLGRFLHHLAAHGFRLTGMADHAVSEAVYLDDPEGNGIEVYADRPRADWYDAAGRFLLGNRPLDLDGLLRAAAAEGRAWQGMPAGSRVGHVHLESHALAASRRCYAGALGLDIMADWRQAVFLSRGGYHHHLAVNDWHGRRRPLDPEAERQGLRYRTFLQPPGGGALPAGAAELRDPAGIPIRLRAAAAAAV